jgi:cellulose synthase operon protein YhjQ
MKTVAMVSSTGGAGRTTFTAELASLLAARGRRTLAVECDPRNVLALHFGLRESARDGLVSHLAGHADAWARAALQSDDGVLVLPWGSMDEAGEEGEEGGADETGADASATLDTRPHWLRDLLERVDLPRDAIALVDCAAWPSPHARQAIDAADLVLALVTPDAIACATLPRLNAALQHAGKESVFVANAVVPARALHTDVIALLRERLGGAMLPYVVHADTGIPAALAGGEGFCVSTPVSQAAHDLNGIASWLAQWAGEPAEDATASGQDVTRSNAP